MVLNSVFIKVDLPTPVSPFNKKKKTPTKAKLSEFKVHVHVNANGFPVESTHTYAEDIEAKSLSNRLADQLVGKTVKAHVAIKLNGSFVFILMDLEREDRLQQRIHLSNTSSQLLG